MSFLNKFFGDSSKKAVKDLEPIVRRINEFEPELEKLSDDLLRAKTENFKKRIKEGEDTDSLLPEAFAVVREASKRTLGQRHYDVQLIGGIALQQGGIAEMKTGEGKTLVATLPAYLNALSGKGVHVVTVNDYLSKRDAAWIGQIYSFLGMTVGVINHATSFIYDESHVTLQDIGVIDKERDELGSFKIRYEFLRPCERKEAYSADIVYGTNSEYGFDYLRDNIAYSKDGIVQRGHNFAIIDEVDSILIDEARTPLIISAPAQESEDFYTTFARIAEKMKQEDDYTVDEKLKAITLTDEGITKAEKILGVENIYTDKGIKYVHHLETAVRAKALFKNDKEYVVRDDQIIIVDEFTGRLQPGRRWSEGLHQAIEAKEGVSVQKESRTVASITYQNYFKLYDKLAGMTGTAMTSHEEFFKVYSLQVISIPTNRPIARTDKDDLIFQTEFGKFKAVASKIKELNKKGQPVLVGTASVQKNELLSAYLQKEGVKHEILNAKNHEREGEIISEAGKKGNVTIATNMAGRGVDIKLGGGEATKEEHEEVISLGGLFVLGTERHEARRIDNQLRGRAGRQGDPGETQFFVSLEDNLMRVFAADAIKKMMGRFGIPEDQPIENRLITKSLENAQTKIEGFYFDARKHVLEYDNILNQQRHYIYDMRKAMLIGEKEKIESFIDEISNIDDTSRSVIEKKRSELGDEFLELFRRLTLQTIDMLWMDHLEQMDYLRGSVNLRAYGQRDPLIEYKKEGLQLFNELKDSIKYQVISLLPNVGTGAFAREEAEAKKRYEQAKVAGGDASESGNVQLISEKPKNKEGEKIGRNDPCPCGSGRKYKKCHGA